MKVDNATTNHGPQTGERPISPRASAAYAQFLSGELQAHAQASGAPKADPAVIEVNVGGVFVATERPSAPGTLLTLDLRFSDAATPVRTVVRVDYVVERAHGREPGMGVSFLDVWGARAAEQLTHHLREADTAAPTARWTMAGTRVLVVDDDDHYRELTAQHMRDAGFEVIVADNGVEALSLAIKHQPSLILSDVTMPGMDGFQLLRLLRARPELRRTPIMFLTALTSDSDRLRGYALGVDDYVPKPFTAVELIARAERALERAHTADEATNVGMRGDLSNVPVASLLAFAELERRTGLLHLTREGEAATLHLRDGAVARIDLADPYDRLQDLERFFHILDWDKGRFELVSAPVPVEDALQVPTTRALLEHARRHDETKAR